ncbi:MAG: hypothetical protein GX147_01715 [Deltaproteobacteria bacterium]|jgi:cell wall-associated NlpC family hydrolase|nr:hypothetical protein [Deltaproteobacteria bacterium]
MPETIRDIRELPQDHTWYMTSEHVLMPDAEQKSADARYNALYFSPWHRTKPLRTLDSVRKSFLKFELNPGYGENLRKRDPTWAKNLRDMAALDGYPNMSRSGITTRNTDLRILPTRKPVFYSRSGYPFDRLQVSLISANTPIYISHVSRDKTWFLVETPYASGWLDARHIALADENFKRKWEKGTYVAIITDKTPIYDDQNHFLFNAPLGSLFPFISETDNTIRIMYAAGDTTKRAITGETLLSSEAAAVKPLPLAGANMIRIANNLTNEAYGWGGLYENRDCSAMLKDMFAPFGLWLSRHSADQAKRDGYFIDLAPLSLEVKEKTIRERGVPYMTLLWMRGHIMLYIGQYEGELLVFHNLWGVSTANLWGMRKRLTVGHAAITTLRPARIFNTSSPNESDFLKNVIGMTLLGEQPDF